MARTSNHYEKWGDNSINIQGRIMVDGHCPSLIAIYIYTPTVVLKLFACQGTILTDGQPDGQSGDYMLPLSGA